MRRIKGKFAEVPKMAFLEFADQVSISTLLTGVMLPKAWWPQRDPDRTRRIQVRDFIGR